MVDVAIARIVECHGSPAAMGEMHGEATRDLIAETLDAWRTLISGRAPAEFDPIARLLAETNFLPAIDRHAPDLLEEVRGIARGANQPFETMLVYNLMDEEWSFRTGRLGPGCTAIAVEGVGIAQTMDIPSVHDGSQVALRLRPDHGSEQIVFTGVGMLGLNGANRDGVGVVVNNLAQLPASSTGLPVMFMLRSILGQKSAAEAGAFVKSVPHAIGQHYLIGDPDQIISLEAAANGVYEVPVAERYVHANHPLANPASRSEAADMERRSNTHARSNAAKSLVREGSDQRDIECALEDRTAPISCAKRDGSMTFGGTSIELTSEPRVRIAFGPPHEAPWTDIPWNS